MSNIIIIGAGMAGLLAARILKMRGHEVKVLEQQAELPNNHNAVLRFRSNVISDITGIPFKKVQMIKCVIPYQNPVAEVLAYSYKCNSMYSTDRSITQGLTISDRWIAPQDFIKQLAGGITIKYCCYQTMAYDLKNKKGSMIDAIISTAPMPNTMQLLNYPGNSSVPIHLFKSTEGYVIKAKINLCNAYATIYNPNPKIPYYRASITGDELTIEFAGNELEGVKMAPELVDMALHDFGMYDNPVGAGTPHEIIKQSYAKIEPIDETMRKKFMAWATDKHNVYSLGRYATWRPGLLLDDLVKDIKLIEGWIIKGNNYDVRRNR